MRRSYEFSEPVITIGNLDRFSKEPNYRSQCADRIIEIVFNIEDYRGAGRIFIP